MLHGWRGEIFFQKKIPERGGVNRDGDSSFKKINHSKWLMIDFFFLNTRK